jgi:Positive regulator of sigma E activity
MGEVVKHRGKIISVSQEEVLVKIERGGACSGCSNKKACQFGESEEHVVVVKTHDASSYIEGEDVSVSLKGSLGLKAVLYAYILPLLLMMATFVVVRLFIFSEPLQILFALIPVVIYYTVLYKLRDKLDNTFNFYISKL